ncbi:MAG TPA: hypothetical protein VMM78_11475 [Thermomicrobiales bacterium]|nr:hypothetical protein [Thermomicrobiales bacterium]
MLDHDLKQTPRSSDDRIDEPAEWTEAGEEEVPTIVLYVVAGLLLISFSLYLAIGGGHSHFH